jgi:hypothetical protein
VLPDRHPERESRDLGARVARRTWLDSRAIQPPRSLDTLGMTAMRTSGFNFEQTLATSN